MTKLVILEKKRRMLRQAYEDIRRYAIENGFDYPGFDQTIKDYLSIECSGMTEENYPNRVEYGMVIVRHEHIHRSDLTSGMIGALDTYAHNKGYDGYADVIGRALQGRVIRIDTMDAILQDVKEWLDRVFGQVH